jgi:hypothetical protein
LVPNGHREREAARIGEIFGGVHKATATDFVGVSGNQEKQRARDFDILLAIDIFLIEY